MLHCKCTQMRSKLQSRMRTNIEGWEDWKGWEVLNSWTVGKDRGNGISALAHMRLYELMWVKHISLRLSLISYSILHIYVALQQALTLGRVGFCCTAACCTATPHYWTVVQYPFSVLNTCSPPTPPPQTRLYTLRSSTLLISHTYFSPFTLFSLTLPFSPSRKICGVVF